MGGPVHHNKKHPIGSMRDHGPVPGATENHVVVFDANGLPAKDGEALSPNEKNQAIGLYVAADRGDDTTGDGSLYNPFKTIQAAVDYADAEYSGEPIEIFIRSFPYWTTAVEDVEIPPGMYVSLWNSTNYYVYLNKLILNQFCYVHTTNIGINELTENDSGDSKYIIVSGGWIDLITPEVSPGIQLELDNTYIDSTRYPVFFTQVLDMLGPFLTNNDVWENVLGQPGEPSEDFHIVNRGHLTKTYRVTLEVSQDHGSDTKGDGWLIPFATVQKAIDEAVVRGFDRCAIIIDATVINQNLTVPNGLDVTLIGFTDFSGGMINPPSTLAFGTITLASGASETSVALNNTSAALVTAETDGDVARVVCEESVLADMTNYSGFTVAILNTLLLATIGTDPFTKWRGVLNGTALWAGIFWTLDGLTAVERRATRSSVMNTERFNSSAVTTTSTTPVLAWSQTADLLGNIKYRIEWSYESQGGGNSEAIGLFERNGNNMGETRGISVTGHSMFSGFFYYTPVANETATFNFVFSRSGTNGTVSIRNMRLSVEGAD